MSDGIKEQSVLKTLAFFDLFDYPLTEKELERFLYKDSDPPASQQGWEARRAGDFFFLLGREEIVEKRKEGEKLFAEKIKIAQKAMRKILWVPFVRAVFVCNTSTGVGIKEGSDIDVFIIVRRGRLWLARILATFTLGLFGLRRTKVKIKNKICLSFYVTDNRLNLSDIALKDDIYLMYWLALLIPIYDPDNLGKSLRAANQWVIKNLPNAFKGEMNREWEVKKNSRIKKFLEKMWGGGYGDVMEHQAREAQKIKLKMNTNSVQDASDTRVIISDEMLKFHEGDRRSEYRDRWLARCKNFIPS